MKCPSCKEEMEYVLCPHCQAHLDRVGNTFLGKASSSIAQAILSSKGGNKIMKEAAARAEARRREQEEHGFFELLKTMETLKEFTIEE